MNADDPRYLVHGYYADSGSFEWSTPVEALCDDRMIDEARVQITPESDSMPDTYCWADLFYCYGTKVRLVGTWVIKPGIVDQPSASWHVDGWAERPKQSKKKALRYLNGLGRPI